MVLTPPALALDAIAVFTHDFRSQSPLMCWPPVPAEQLHQGEKLAIHAFGELAGDLRSPAHMYHASWRDPDSNPYLEGDGDKPVTGILFVGNFGVAPYALTASLLETAEMFNRLDRALFKFELALGADGEFRLEWLELEMTEPGSKRGSLFRSVWKGAEEIRGLDLTLSFDPPGARRDAFRFHVQGRLPRRYNRGDKIEDEHVVFTASGGAMPLPRWVNY